MYTQLYVNLFLCLVLLSVVVMPVAAQDREASTLIKETIPGPQRLSETNTAIQSGIVVDTLRNFEITPEIFLWESGGAGVSNEGWVHGTNIFADRAKGTKLSVPDEAIQYAITEVLVTFAFKAATVTTQTYNIQVYTVDETSGGPGTEIASQTFNMADLDLDDDLETPALLQGHVFTEPVEVPAAFFVVVNFGEYGESDVTNLAIAASDLLGRFVEEDWELLFSNEWVNISTSWFENADNGWNMWVEAIVEPVMVTTNIEDSEVPQEEFLRLYPNPFRSVATIEYSLPIASTVSLDVYDLLGRSVKTLIDGVVQTPGIHAVQWDGTDDAGQALANGVYMYSLRTGDQQLTRTVVVFR